MEEQYISPLGSRYASREMRANFSDRTKFTTWRRLWIALAESEQELGLAISDEQLDELRAHATDLDLDLAAKYEKELRHDVMAHVHAWGDVCPKARPIIHLGATSCFVGDNTDLIIMREGLRQLRGQVVGVLGELAAFAREWKDLPTLGFTHFQPAQATTVGKRACLWIQDLVHDLDDLEQVESQIRFRGVKGTTGTQASFLELFEGDHERVRKLDELVTRKMGFERTFGVTGQTYPRKLDFRVLQVLSSISQSAHKFATDLRLLANKRELEEPFGSKQIGSSAMPWKRNPMRSERICALSRFVIELVGNAAHTAANQWLERTLDDSANRRLSIAEGFLATDAVLSLYCDVAGGLLVHPPIVARHLNAELPFLASEAVMMEAVKAGGDRQDLHERIRVHSHAAAAEIKAGREPDLRERLAGDPAFEAVAGSLDDLLDGRRFVGRAPEQVEEFLEAEVDPILDRYSDIARSEAEIRV
ncbi:MAG: adenylosuccinate lyase [Planctomycetota bacterium]|nr:adenylosuccinate lyase [Planctomycetota bacterium]MDG1984032.1 adenylosuccinate lyase [Planctomycetota bacterium]